MINFLLILLQSKQNPEFTNIVSIIFTIVVFLLVCYGIFKFVEGFYVDFIAKRPLFRHFILFTKELNPIQKKILEQDFAFYKHLEFKEKKYFRHRVYKFISQVEFTGKENLIIDDEKKTLVAATAIMLTFGYRDYAINLVDKIIIYPSTFYSIVDKNYHKGHFNPGYRAIILSWEDFIHGYEIANDNLNLGIHEVVHALHISYLNTKDNNDISANIFINGLHALTTYLNENSVQLEAMKNSNYFRSYAFENDFELTAVIIETFLETPKEFKSRFPKVYKYVKQMLNFNFAGY